MSEVVVRWVRARDIENGFEQAAERVRRWCYQPVDADHLRNTRNRVYIVYVGEKEVAVAEVNTRRRTAVVCVSPDATLDDLQFLVDTAAAAGITIVHANAMLPTPRLRQRDPAASILALERRAKRVAQSQSNNSSNT